jgi:hypothetical protein
MAGKQNFYAKWNPISPVGSEIVAEILADFIQKERLITDKREKYNWTVFGSLKRVNIVL